LPLLVSRGVVTRAQIVSSSVEVQEVFGRNRNFTVRTGGGQGLFVRQSVHVGRPGAAGLRFEADLLERVPSGGDLAATVPELVDYDPRAQVLTERLISGSPIWDLLPAGDVAPSLKTSHAIGVALARCHRQLGVLCALGDDRWAERLPAQPPGVLQRRTGLPAEPSDAQRIIIQLAHADEALVEGLAKLLQDYRVNAVIHGDIKWANCMIGSPGGAVVLVDWETVRIGDVAWDLAGLLQSLLQRWVAVVAQHDDGEALSAVRTSAGATLTGYSDEFGLAGASRGELARRSVRMAAARLVQTAIEGSRLGDQPDVFAAQLVQLASNVLADPTTATAELFGFAEASP
jgi:tRNA A-37 threonylcarbamoyl transferase component Bud32